LINSDDGFVFIGSIEGRDLIDVDDESDKE
jgi:hypothetical protein